MSGLWAFDAGSASLGGATHKPQQLFNPVAFGQRVARKMEREGWIHDAAGAIERLSVSSWRNRAFVRHPSARIQSR